LGHLQIKVEIDGLDFKNQDLLIDKPSLLTKGYKSPKVISPIVGGDLSLGKEGGPFRNIRIRNRNQSMLHQPDPFNGYHTPKLKLDMLSPKTRSNNASPRSQFLSAHQTNDYSIKINITQTTTTTLST
jgi:hypothetical protein